MNERTISDRLAGEPGWSRDSLNHSYEGPLRACPFCASRETRLYEHVYARQFAFACDSCGAHGPRRASPEAAAEQWNRRDGGGA